LVGMYRPDMPLRDGHFGLVFLRFAVAGAVAVLIAYLSRKNYEERFLRLKDRVVPQFLKESRINSPITSLVSDSPAAVAAEADRVQTA